MIGTLLIENTKSWLISEVTGSASEGFTITNNVPQKWAIQKVSSTDETEHLADAEFTLTRQEEDLPAYYGKSNKDGVVEWWDDYSVLGNLTEKLSFIPDGQYVLKETKAPAGYLKSEEEWKIEIEDLQIVSITSGGNPIEAYTPQTRAVWNWSIYLYKDTPIYKLPSAGGPGIYWYTIGGMLLMIAGTLVLYKNKRREVLKR